MRLLFFCAALFFCLGCNHTRVRMQSAARTLAITETEREYLLKYAKIRKKVTTFCRLPEDATSEEVRPHIARFLTLPPDASWEDILGTPLAERLCTEAWRERLTEVFCLKPDATWIELGLRVEELWTRLQAPP